MYQAGTLSGNPLALAAGLAQLREMERTNGWKRLESLGLYMEQAIRKLIVGKPFTFHRIGSMFCLYFSGNPVRNLTDAKLSDTAAFACFFHKALSSGIYLAPSQFEAGFLSTAHTQEDLERVVGVLKKVL